MSAEFEPVKLGPRRRRIDPVAVGVVVVTAALVVAVVKPWGGGEPGIAAVPPPAIIASASPATPSFSPEPPPISAPGVRLPPTWSDVAPVISRRPEWGIRTLVIGSSAESLSAASPHYTERWVAADVDGRLNRTLVVDGQDVGIVALGITFPPAETPLAVRIWLERAGGELEWIDARPVDTVPARGAYLFLRPSVAGAAVRSWGPGRYRVDILVGDDSRRIDIEVPNRFGVLPGPEPWVRVVPRINAPDGPGLEGLPVGLFAQVDGAAVPLGSTEGPLLDEAAAWLDLDRQGTDLQPRSFVARTYRPSANRLGVVLPPSATIRSAVLRRLAPFDDTTGIVGETTTGSGDTGSFVAFAPAGGATWRPGVYALTVEWVDGDGAHERTWHAELRPGPLSAEPALLSATREWARQAGSSGVLLGTTESIDPGSEASGIRLLPITPQAGTRYPGLSGTNLIGCGDTFIRGRPTVVGLVGPVGTDLTPVASRILYPFADAGPLPVLTAAGTIPGLALVAPFLTAEFGGPAAYGFRAGASADAPGYTICVGLVSPVG